MTVVLLQTQLKCIICASDLDSAAQRCLKCSTWQNWKRFVPASQLTLALLISLISVLSAVVPPVLAYFANHSHTYVRVLGDGALIIGGNPYPQQTILVLVANTGRRPSLVKSASISFDGINAAPTVLDIYGTDQKLLLPDKQVQFHLTAPAVARTNGATKASPEEIYATITVAVEETDVQGNFVAAARPPRCNNHDSGMDGTICLSELV